VNSSARVPTKDVPSCEKLGEGARSLRTRDLLMGIPITAALCGGERPELKHLSRGRKRNQTETS